MHRAKGDRFVRANELPVCDNEADTDIVHRGRSRMTGKGVRIYKGMEIRFAVFI